jgi:polysaccharide chain length determinant protein (PEP-CTERM system associated)
MDTTTHHHSSGLVDYLGALRRRYIYLATILPAALFICVVAAFAITPKYRSTSTIMLETSSVPKDIIETTVISYADQQIEIVEGRVMTVESLEPIVKELDPYPKKTYWTPAEKAQRILEDTALERVDPVTLKPQAESNAFSLHYDNPNPGIATAMNGRLAKLFLEYNQRVRTEAASEARGFLQKQSEGLIQQMRDNDAKIADLKRKYGEALPEFLLRNQSTAEELQHQQDTLQQQILSAQEKESVLSLQLTQMSPNLITQSGDLTDVATVRAKLLEAEQRYTPDHPEVKRLKHALEQLMAQTAAGGASTQAPNNPQYQLTQTQLKAARNELASLQRQFNATTAKLAQRRELVAQAPAAEKAVSEIFRHKEALQSEFQRVQDKLQSANLAETFESQQGGERFALVHPSSVPGLPVYPNRVGLILIGLVFGAAVAGIAIALAESADRRIRMASDLHLPEGIPMLAAIPFISNAADRRAHRAKLRSLLGAYSMAVAVMIAVIISSWLR